MGNCTSKKQEKIKKKKTKFKPPSVSKSEDNRLSEELSRKSRPSLLVVDTRNRASQNSLERDNEDAKSATVFEVSKKSRDLDLIKNCLKSHFLFKFLPDDIIYELTTNMKLYKLKPGSNVFEQDKPGSTFFIIKKGKVEISVDNSVREVLEQGKGFGEVALIQEIKRNSTAKCLSDTELWGLSREKYRAKLSIHQKKQYEENKEFIRSIPLFNLLKDKDIDSLIDVLALHTFNQCEIIVNEGDPGDLLYIIKSGNVGCYIKGEEVRKQSTGDFFGEQALLYDTKRTATVIALDTVCLLSLGRNDLDRVLGNQLQTIIYKNSQKIAFEKSKYLENLLEFQLEAIVNHMEIQKYNKNDLIIKKKENKSERLWVILNGYLAGENKYKLFSCIGDEDIYEESNQKFKENVIAKEDSVVGVISAKEIVEILGNDLKTVSNQNKLVRVLRKVPLLKPLPVSKLQSLVGMFEIQVFQKNQVLFKYKDPGNSLYIINQGKVNILRDNTVIRSIGPNDFFGERAILKNEPRTATVVALVETKCWVLNREDFLGIIDSTVKNNLIKRMQLQNDSINITDLTIVSLLGKGQFGSVFLCTDKNKVEYALKIVPRKLISHYDLVENLTLERKILLQLDHPMIVKLVKTFKDNKRVYFLMEYVKGMDLFDVLRSLNVLKEADSLFYAACIILILEYVHSLNIIYRDLKPENIVVDYDGYPKLIDFGISKIVDGRTYTVVGTPHYMAPEVINGKGYGINSDYWSLGIMIYEFIYCNVPFASREDDPYAVYEAVLQHNLIFPDKGTILTANNLIAKLLSPNPSMRGSIENIKSHKWFKGVPWENLLSKIFKPPYIPNVKPSKQSLGNSKDIIAYLNKYEAQNINLGQGKNGDNWDFEF